MTERQAAGSVGQTDPAAAVEIKNGDIKNSIHSKVKNFIFETSNTANKKYELFNVLNENGDSIYVITTTTTSNSNEVEQKGQFYVSIDIIEELCDQINSLQKAMALLRKDLVSAGVLKKV